MAGPMPAIGLPTPTTTSVQRTLTFDRRYQFRVRATDGRGNTSAYQVGPVVRPGRYQETTSLATYVGGVVDEHRRGLLRRRGALGDRPEPHGRVHVHRPGCGLGRRR